MCGILYAFKDIIMFMSPGGEGASGLAILCSGFQGVAKLIL